MIWLLPGSAELYGIWMLQEFGYASRTTFLVVLSKNNLIIQENEALQQHTTFKQHGSSPLSTTALRQLQLLATDTSWNPL